MAALELAGRLRRKILRGLAAGLWVEARGFCFSSVL